MHQITSFTLLIGAIALLQACASSTGPVRDGALDCEGLTRISGTGLGGVCVREGVSGDFGRALLGDVDYGFQPVGTSSGSVMAGQDAKSRYPVGPQQKSELKSLVPEAFNAALGALDLTAATEPGDGVLRVQGQIIDVLLETPEDQESGAKYLFDTIARATLVVEFYDSATDQLLLRAFDHRETEPLAADSSQAGSHMEALADLWQALLIESAEHLPN